jgi:hypothetical protein
MEAKLIQVMSTTTKHANKGFLSRLGNFFPHFSLEIEGWLWATWVVSFGGFDYFLFFMVVGGWNKLESSFFTLVITPLKANTQFVCEFCCTLLDPTQVILNYFLSQ